MRPHTVRRGGGRGRLRGGLAGRLPARCSAAGSCSSATSTTCSPSGRSRPPTPTRASRCTRTASAWPAPSSWSCSATKADATGTQAGFFAWADAVRLRRRRLRALPRHRGPRADQLLQVRPSRQAPVGDPHRAPTAPGCWRRCVARLGPRRRARRAGRQPVLRRHHRRSPACWWGRTSPASLAAEPEGHRYLLPDVCLSNGRFLDGTAPRGPAPPRRGGRHRRPRAARGARARRPRRWSATMTPPHRRHRRPAQRRQVDPGEPHRRASASRSWRRSPASPATARRSTPSGRACPSASSTPAAGCPAATDLDAKVSRQSEQAIRDADAVIMVIDAITGVTEEDSRVAEVVRNLATRQGAPRRQQGRRRQPRGPHLGGAVARPRRPARRSARSTAAAPATCSTASSRCCPQPERRSEDADGDAEDEADEERIFSVALVGPAERRQVHAVQPAHRRGPGRRARPARHHPRHGRHDRRDRRGADPLRRHRRHAPQGQDRRGHRVLLAGAGPAGGRHVRRRPADHRLAPSASPPRTSAWPSASTPPAARSWCCSTSGSCSPTPRRGPTSTTRSSERLRFIGEAPVLKISALTGKGVQQAACRRCR